MKAVQAEDQSRELSPWWRYSALLVFIVGMCVLIYISANAYRDAPPIPEKVVGPEGETVFTSRDVADGQGVFLKYGLMENGTIWGHGAYLGPDFTAEYLHTLAIHANEVLAREIFGKEFGNLSGEQQEAVNAETRWMLKNNRYDPEAGVLKFTEAEKTSFEQQIDKWAAHFEGPETTGGLPEKFIQDPEEIRQLTAFFAWTAWASAAKRPGKEYSYTNNFPYDPMVGNTITSEIGRASCRDRVCHRV